MQQADTSAVVLVRGGKLRDLSVQPTALQIPKLSLPLP